MELKLRDVADAPEDLNQTELMVMGSRGGDSKWWRWSQSDHRGRRKRGGGVTISLGSGEVGGGVRYEDDKGQEEDGRKVWVKKKGRRVE